MSEFGEVLLKGGPLALVVAIALAGKYLAEAIKAARSGKTEAARGSMTDAATVNTMITEALKAEREENLTMTRRLTELEVENTTLKDQLFSQRTDYEAQLGELRRKLQEITLQLDALQARLHTPADGD